MAPALSWHFQIRGERLARLVSVLKRWPEGRELARSIRQTVETRRSRAEPDTADYANLSALLELAGAAPSEKTGDAPTDDERGSNAPEP
jgi:hypothetical protein